MHIAKFNQLLRIEKLLGAAARFAERSAFKHKDSGLGVP